VSASRLRGRAASATITPVPQHLWPLSFDEIAEITNGWSDDDGTLVTWAVWAADGLHHLLDVDDIAFGVVPRDLSGFSEEVLDLAHVRWASASAITTLDLCAGTLGRRRCPARGNEYSLREFDPRRMRRADARAVAEERLQQLDSREADWVFAATNDPDYDIVLNARNPMTHGRLKRTLYGRTSLPGPHQDRTGSPVGPSGSIVDSRELLKKCSSVATRHVEAFLRLIAAQAGGAR
jgi:hypothetical protein